MSSKLHGLLANTHMHTTVGIHIEQRTCYRPQLVVAECSVNPDRKRQQQHIVSAIGQ